MGMTIDESPIYEMGYNRGFKDGIKGSIPKSVLEDIKAKISDMYPNYIDEKGYRMVRKSDVLNIIDKHMEREDDK